MCLLLMVWSSVTPELAAHLPLWGTQGDPCLSGDWSVVELQNLLGPFSILNDDFDVGPLDPSWTVVNGDNYLREFLAGRLILTPTTYTQWYQEQNSGGLIAKLVQGNIKITARIRARSAGNPSLPVTGGPFQLGGLMMRNPAGASENYIFVAVGLSGGSLGIETKTTQDNSSVFQASPWGNGDAELRLCRIGSRFFMYARPINGGAWMPGTPNVPFFDRPDLPLTLMAGPIAYGPTATPDLQAEFEEISYEPAFTECDCTLD